MSTSDAEALADAVISYRDQNGPFLTRAHLINVAEFLSTTYITDNSDARREELIGKATLFLDAQPIPSTYRVITVAQSFRDVVGDGADISITYLQDDGTTATKSTCRLGQYDHGADQILSETKVMATINRAYLCGDDFISSPIDKWVWNTLKYQYLED